MHGEMVHKVDNDDAMTAEFLFEINFTYVQYPVLYLQVLLSQYRSKGGNILEKFS